MKVFRPLWAEGVLLSPQHSQQQNLWDEGALEIGKLKATEIKAIMPDGSVIDTAQLDVLPPAKDLNLAPDHISSFLVSLGLPVLRADGRNYHAVGEPGVGKTALVEGLALKIAEGSPPAATAARCVS